ncbi:MAG TPA: hypothetical protein DCL35_03760 [Candidatus Omnitrophica bacterium]|nr:hypothetical protein [Candidatus Omnitrophota bacterium]
MKKLIRAIDDLSGFTLIELVVVVIIMSILVALAVPTYTNTKEKALDKEAVMALKLIRSASKQYFAKFEHFYPYTGSITSLSNINNNLSLDLSGSNWGFALSGTGTAFTANATRTGSTRRWTINQAASEPSCVTACL